MPEREPPRLIGCWYTNNAIHPEIMSASLTSLKKAVEKSIVPVEVRTCSWEALPKSCPSFKNYVTHFPIGVHFGIAIQILRILYEVYDEQRESGLPYAMCFLEHDVLYPHDYFDRVAAAFANSDSVVGVANWDYIGMNQSGWLEVTCRQEPLHQFSLTFWRAMTHLQNVMRDCMLRGGTTLEPTPSSFITRLPFEGKQPAVHINHSRHFTSHYNCFGKNSKGVIEHSYWGNFSQYFPKGEKSAGYAPE